ncbi:unnamed protein product [Haemonchus placei]|uniref:Neprosin domain-containing protein n=1 Tax=Haemonchus placei TaxID=6290 RepID=A0A0N4VW83_HAEPC|nr:unnamed protein product [Haemonchus placei]
MDSIVPGQMTMSSSLQWAPSYGAMNAYCGHKKEVVPTRFAEKWNITWNGHDIRIGMNLERNNYVYYSMRRPNP